MSTPASSPAVGLPQLPSELLRLVWDQLQVRGASSEHDTQSGAVARAQDQHALRCACKQLRDATTPFLSSVPIITNLYEPAETPSRDEMLRCALRQLAAFPAAATLTALRWAYVTPTPPGCSSDVELSQLLPDFFDYARERLAGVQHVTLAGQQVLGYGEISALVDTCPRLQSLALRSGTVLGSALSPLARLASLRSLHIHWIDGAVRRDAEQSARIYKPLTQLSALTKLRATACYADDVLPHLHGLASLRELQMDETYMRKPHSGDDAAFGHFSCLAQLTSLSMMVTSAGGHAWALSSGLALPSQLVVLCLDNVTLRTAAIRLVCSLPCLSELSVRNMAPDCDLSGLACSYTKLALEGSDCPLQLTRLPLQSVQAFCLDEVEWSLESMADVMPDTLRRAIHILATATHRLHDDYNGNLYLRLVCEDAFPLPSASSLLAALAPLNSCARGVFLALGWDVSRELADLLAAHLPNLKTLQVHACQPGFAGFAAAVRAKLPRLRVLKAWGKKQLPQVCEDALLAVATLRAANGPPLTIEVFGAGGVVTSSGWRERCIAAVELMRDSVGRSPHNEVVMC